jgi:hypothetical protein
MRGAFVCAAAASEGVSNQACQKQDFNFTKSKNKILTLKDYSF